jgi:hypothetical protein
MSEHLTAKREGIQSKREEVRSERASQIPDSQVARFTGNERYSDNGHIRREKRRNVETELWVSVSNSCQHGTEGDDKACR